MSAPHVKAQQVTYITCGTSLVDNNIRLVDREDR